MYPRLKLILKTSDFFLSGKERKWMKRIFTIKQDIRVLEHILKRHIPWSQFAKSLGLTFDTTYNRWRYDLRTAIAKKTMDKKITFQEATIEMLRELRELDRAGETISPVDKEKLKWTRELNEKLNKLVSKVGPFFQLLGQDFPGFTPVELRLLYCQQFGIRFNPLEDEKLLELQETKMSTWDIHFNHFPKHSPIAIWDRLRYLKKYGILSQESIERISIGVSEHERDYFYNLKDEMIQKRKGDQLLKEWAFFEPVEQKRALWYKHLDVELVSSVLQNRNSPFLTHIYQLEKQNRFYHLSTTTIPELKERFRIGSLQ